MIDSPSIVPEIVSDAALAAAVATIQQLAHAKREGDRDAVPQFERVPGLRETVHEVANGKTYAEIQGGRWGKRSREKRERNEKMAREYQKRELAYEFQNEAISFTDLAIQIGRLPEFNLKKRAAIDAIKRGLAIINRHRAPSI
jgi:gamma-glutamylcysteine synthetase